MIGPRFGEDAAVIDLGDRYLILKSDPVTFTAQELGWYAVHVNANDIAVMGARPRWFQTTLIAPPGTDDGTVRRILRDVHIAAKGLGIAITGGHTEISPAVRQPIIAGDMQGTVAHDRLITSGGARPGDVILLTKWAAIEGTSILAREFPAVARRLLGERGQRRAARFHHRPGISVVPEALLAARLGATALHDPTEGGVAAAVYELAVASSCRIELDLEQIPVHPITTRLCAHFRISPLGLIASGSLLAAVPPQRLRRLMARLARMQIAATPIGAVQAGHGVRARRAGKRVPFEWSERDALTQVL
ncbi:MAG TPA: AIR synthase family protein [Candidatus Binatia bacterium]|nr:AIR synthase family protein [Candidatus Binatia bacterium]